MRIQTTTGRSGANVTPEKYALVRRAILDSLPASGPGLTLKELVQIVGTCVPLEMFPTGVRWYTQSVKLDLEAKHLVRRVPHSSPTRFIKKA